ncbi:hypothetical protein QBC43DRAFT_106387 [Cladorrhinum sp. PSN259]|nr:hypothetical protein QBC43DRAFT_106387 [Cladorrhinum sp. PSN259]
MPPPTLRLRHIHLPTPGSTPSTSPSYSLASRLQSSLRRRLLDLKDSSSSVSSPPPVPTLISFSPLPIYTLGRRQTTPLTPVESARLQAPLYLPSCQNHDPLPVRTLHSPRGGLTTYHGPGQIVLWPVIDLKSKQHSQFTVRCYSRLLENTTISTLHKLFGLKAQVTDDPGVWVEFSGQLQKIAALGVHLRRYVSGLGTAINVDMDGSERGDESSNPWKRVVACGLEGKKVTSVREVLGDREGLDERLRVVGGEEGEETREAKVAHAWASEFAERIGVVGVERVGRIELRKVLEILLEEGSGRGEGEEGEEFKDEERKYLEVLLMEKGL